MSRLLAVQDEIAMALVKAQVGQTVRVLVEGYGRAEGTLSGRLDNNLTVEFAADDSLMGSYAMVHLTGARPPFCWVSWPNNVHSIIFLNKEIFTMDCIDLFKRAAMALQTDPVTWFSTRPGKQTIRMKSSRT